MMSMWRADRDIPEHHHIEEEEYFPKIEAATGDIGLMARNVEQHREWIP